MPERVGRGFEDVSEYAARDALNALACLHDPALQALRARHAARPLPATVAYREARELLEALGRPFEHVSSGPRSYWVCIEGEQLRAKPLTMPPRPPGAASDARPGKRGRWLPRAG
jgi:hypothetical protein